MGKNEIIGKKINDYFNKKAVILNQQADKFKIIISFNQKLNYELRNDIGIVEENASLKEILNLSLIEKIAVTEDKIENWLMQAITRGATEQNTTNNNIQLVLYPKNRYCLFKEKKYIREINLNEII